MSKKQRARKQAEIDQKKKVHARAGVQRTGYEKTLKWVGIGAGVVVLILAIVLGFWYYSRHDVVAYVAGEKITRSDVDSYFQYYLYQQQMQGLQVEPNSEEWDTLWNEAFELTIQEKLALKEAERLGMKPTADEIKEKINQLLAEQQMTEEELKQNLSKQGRSWNEFEEGITLQIERQKIYEYATKSATVLESDVQDYFTQYQQTYNQPEKVGIRLIYLSTDTAKNGNRSEADTEKLATELLAKLQAGEDFAALAKQYSEHSESKEKGGDLGLVKAEQFLGTFGAEFDKVAFSLEIGETSGIVNLSKGLGLLQVYDRVSAYNASLSDRWQYHFRQIQVGEEAAAKSCLEQLNSGSDFIELAKSTSTDTITAPQGGDMGTVLRNTLKDWQLTSLNSLEPGQYSSVIAANGQFYILKLEEFRTISETIFSNLLTQRQSEAWTNFIEELKKKFEVITLT